MNNNRFFPLVNTVVLSVPPSPMQQNQEPSFLLLARVHPAYHPQVSVFRNWFSCTIAIILVLRSVTLILLYNFRHLLLFFLPFIPGWFSLLWHRTLSYLFFPLFFSHYLFISYPTSTPVLDRCESSSPSWYLGPCSSNYSWKPWTSSLCKQIRNEHQWNLSRT